MKDQDTAVRHFFGLPMMVEVPAITETSLGLGQGVYVRLFWAAYLGALPFALWDVLQMTQGVRVEEIRPLTVEILAQVLNCQRSAILGRKSSSGRGVQDGALSVLLHERIAWHTTTGRGRQRQHRFEVLPNLPILTPRQAEQMPRMLREYHESFLGAVRGFDLPAWRHKPEASFVGKFGQIAT